MTDAGKQGYPNLRTIMRTAYDFGSRFGMDFASDNSYSAIVDINICSMFCASKKTNLCHLCNLCDITKKGRCRSTDLYILVFQAPQWDDFHPIGPRVGHLAARQHYHQIRLTDRHLLLFFVVFTNQSLKFHQMTRTILNLLAA